MSQATHRTSTNSRWFDGLALAVSTQTDGEADRGVGDVGAGVSTRFGAAGTPPTEHATRPAAVSVRAMIWADLGRSRSRMRAGDGEGPGTMPEPFRVT